MSENAKHPTAQNSPKQSETARNPQTGEFQEPLDPENAKNAKEGSDWLGGPQNGNVNDRGRIPGVKIQDPPEYNAEKAKNSKEGADWLGGPQNGNETASESTYQQNGQSWLGGPQNGDETLREAEKTLQEKPPSDISGPTGSGK